MRGVNVRLIIILGVSLVVLGVGGFALHRFQIRRNAYIFLREAETAQDRADKARQEGRRTEYRDMVQRVSRNYQAYLALRPEDTEAMEKFGLFLADHGMLGAAMERLQQVLLRDPSRQAVRRRLVELAVNLGTLHQRHEDPLVRAEASGRFLLARDHLQQLLKQSGEDSRLLELLARCQAALGQEDEAVKLWEQAIQLDPAFVEAYLRLAAFLRHRLRSGEDADRWIEKLVEDNQRNPAAYTMAGNYFREREQPQEALRLAESALDLEPDNRDALVLASRCLVALGNRSQERRRNEEAKKYFAQAREYAERGRELYPRDVDLYAVIAELESRGGNFAEATKVLELGLVETRNHPQLLWYAANMLIDAGRVDEARKRIAQLRDTPYPEPLKDLLDARCEFVEERWREAITRFERLRPSLLAWPLYLKQLDFWVGKAYGELDNFDEEVRAYRRALDVDPQFTPAQVALAQTLRRQGQIDAALDVFRQYAGRGAAGGWLTAAQIMAERNRRGGGTERDWLRVEEALQNAEKEEADASQIALLRAEVLAVLGRTTEADKVLAAALAADPQRGDLWVNRIALAGAQKNWDQADTLLTEAEKLLGDRPEVRLARARYLLQRYGSEAIPELRRLGENRERFSRTEQVQLLSGLMNLALAADDAAHARRLCRDLANLQPNNVQVRFRLLGLLLRTVPTDETDADAKQMGQTLQEIDRLLKDIERIEGQGPIWHYGMAVRYILQAQGMEDPVLQAAMKHLLVVREQRPTWPDVHRLLGGIFDRQGNAAAAIESFRRAVDLGDRSVEGVRRLAQLLYDRGRFAEAQDYLRLLEGRAGGATAAVEWLESHAAHRLGDAAGALESARKAAASSGNYRDHLWLGQLAFAAARQASAGGSPQEVAHLQKEAETALARAVELSPQTPETWVELVRFYGGIRAKDKAEEAIAQARLKLPPRTAPLALAQCYLAIDRPQEAAQLYQQALAEYPDDIVVLRSVIDFFWRMNEAARAEALLRRILEGQVAAQPSDVVWARRVQAVILASQGGGGNLQKARKLIEENLKLDGASIADRRLRAALLIESPLAAEREEARRVLESLLESGESSSPEDQFYLAQLYLLQGSWGMYTRQMGQLLAKHGDQPRYLVHYIDALLRHGELGNAELYLRRLEQVASGIFEETRLRVELLLRRGEVPAALAALKAYVNNEKAQPAELALRQRLAAEVIERFLRAMRGSAEWRAKPEYPQITAVLAQEAAAHFRAFTIQAQAPPTLLAAFLVRLGEIGQALDVFAPVAAESKPELVNMLITELTRAPVVSSEELSRFDDLVQPFLEKLARPPALVLSLAKLCQQHGRFEEAERLYREVMRRDSGKLGAVSQNDLAYLFALRRQRADEALELVSSAEKVLGPLPALLDTRAMVYLALRKPQQALEELKKAIDQAPSATYYFHQAQAYLEAGNRPAAAAAAERAFREGLNAETLHPLERTAFEELQTLLAQVPAPLPSSAYQPQP